MLLVSWVVLSFVGVAALAFRACDRAYRPTELSAVRPEVGVA